MLAMALTAGHAVPAAAARALLATAVLAPSSASLLAGRLKGDATAAVPVPLPTAWLDKGGQAGTVRCGKRSCRRRRPAFLSTAQQARTGRARTGITAGHAEMATPTTPEHTPSLGKVERRTVFFLLK